jgi:hypothetical protein
MQLLEKYKKNFDVSSEGHHSTYCPEMDKIGTRAHLAGIFRRQHSAGNVLRLMKIRHACHSTVNRGHRQIRRKVNRLCSLIKMICSMLIPYRP